MRLRSCIKPSRLHGQGHAYVAGFNTVLRWVSLPLAVWKCSFCNDPSHNRGVGNQNPQCHRLSCRISTYGFTGIWENHTSSGVLPSLVSILDYSRFPMLCDLTCTCLAHSEWKLHLPLNVGWDVSRPCSLSVARQKCKLSEFISI